MRHDFLCQTGISKGAKMIALLLGMQCTRESRMAGKENETSLAEIKGLEGNAEGAKIVKKIDWLSSPIASRNSYVLSKEEGWKWGKVTLCNNATDAINRIEPFYIFE